MFRFKNKLTTLNPFRFYHAAVYADIIKKPARLKIDQDLTSLQSLTDGKIGPWIVTPDPTDIQWRTILKISNNSIDWEQCYSQNESIFFKKKIMSPPSERINPKQLYAIDQEIWDRFIDTLKNQNVVHLLNLKHHRHLWLGYNFALSAPTEDLIYKRARLIGDYHFLLSIIIPPNTSTNTPWYKERLVFRDFYNDSECWQINPFYQSSAINTITEIKNDVENGLFNMAKMTGIHSGLIPLLLNKLRHCPNVLDVYNFADIIAFKPTTTQHVLNADKHQHEAIQWLSSSTEHPKIFDKTVHLLRAQSHPSWYLRGDESSQLFFNSRKKWGSYNEQYIKQKLNAGDILDYFNAISKDLIQWQLSQKIRETIKNGNQISAQFIEDTVKKHIRSLIIGSRTLCKIDQYQERWHRNLGFINAIKPTSKISWTPLIKTISIEGIQVNALTSEVELKAHGQEMGHCVGGYSNSCRQDQANIIELVDKKNIRSTLQLKHNQSGNVQIIQHRSYNNELPTSQHAHVASLLVKRINSGEIKVNQVRITEIFQRSISGYEDWDLTVQENIYQMYKEKKLLPSAFIAPTHQEMIEKVQIEPLIKEIARQEAPRIARTSPNN